MKTFKRNLLLSYGISLVLLIASSVASYISIRNLLYSADLVDNTNRIINELNSLMLGVKDGEAGQRGYLLTGDRRYLVPYQEARTQSMASSREVASLTAANDEQRQDAATLNALTERRFSILQQVIQQYNRFGKTQVSDLDAGRTTLQELSVVVQRMESREQILLAARTDDLKQFSTLTPLLIVLASLLAIIVTGVSFARINADLEKRAQLQKKLEEKDREISQRLALVQSVANQISAGDYRVKVSDEGKDALGGIASSLNKMAASLAHSFAILTDKEWLQAGIASLNENIIIDQDIKSLAHHALTYITEYSGSQAGAFYVLSGEGTLDLQSSYALTASQLRPSLALGEGLAGQCAERARIMELRDLVPDDYALSIVSGQVKPRAVVAIPILYNNVLKGVVELASLTPYAANQKDFFKAVSENVGIAINSAHSRERVQQLLEETQAQTEELQVQHSELENINAELETQAEKLQASEEELRVQQEELQQANQELEERSRTLEEKNELILERNLEIQAKAEELALSTSYKSEFLANMSHELRTPLNSILLLSRLLSENHESNLSSDQIEYANVIQSSGKGLLSLIDEILDLSKIEAGKMELEYTDVKMQEVIHDLLGLFTPIAKDKGVSFKAMVQAEVPPVLETDRLRLDQILRNLISNALKFTKKGSVDITVNRTGTSLAFAVKDTGIGIPESKQKTIFEAFQQADGSTRRQFGGTGLGLSISRELAKLLGGEIKVTSEVGQGSEFTLVVPLHRSHPLARPEPLVIPEANSLPSPEVPLLAAGSDEYLSKFIPAAIPDDRDTIAPGDKVILMIEDDTNFARSLLDYTRSRGYKGVVAVRGDEGLDLARRYLPVGILLDVQLPIKSGWEVMDELKADPVTRPIPVHMMSSYQVKNRSLSKGALDFIDKPVAFEKLSGVFAKIEEALSRHPKKVMIVEEDARHAQALSYFLRELRRRVRDQAYGERGDRGDQPGPRGLRDSGYGGRSTVVRFSGRGKANPRL